MRPRTPKSTLFPYTTLFRSHAFDYNEIKNQTIIVKTLPEGTPFVTLDEKERKLSAEDLMICDSLEPMCIAGVFGGLHSRSEEHTSELQSHVNLVCRLLLEKK